MIASYRDPRYAASIRIEHLLEGSGALAEEIPTELRTIHSRRVARTSAGLVAVAGFTVTALQTGLQAIPRPPIVGLSVSPTVLLLGAVAASLVTYAIARVVAPLRFESQVRATLDAGGDELTRLARMESDGLRHAAVRIASRRERASLALPLAGLGLLAPLAMHFLVFCALSIDKERLDLGAFDWWIGASLLLVGVAHAVLAFMAWRFASKIAATPTRSLHGGSPVSGWAALGWTVVGSLVPGVIALAIPPVLVFLTGALFIPASFGFLYRRALRERVALESAA